MAIFEIGTDRRGLGGHQFFSLESSTGSVNLNPKVEELPVFEWMNQSSIEQDVRGHKIGLIKQIILRPLESFARMMLVVDEGNRPIKEESQNGR